eukprot:125249_1
MLSNSTLKEKSNVHKTNAWWTNVRSSRRSDAAVVNLIMRKAWPKEPTWRNRQYWANIFSTPSSQRHGYVIEIRDSNARISVIGFAIYEWTKPKKNTSNELIWSTSDFNCKQYSWGNGIQNSAQWNTNKNLKHHMTKLSRFVLHITDFTIDPDYRGKGCGTVLMEGITSSFPIGSRFCLEVKQNNVAAIKCYKKCGFVIKRKLNNYYGHNQSAYKMIYISSDWHRAPISKHFPAMSVLSFVGRRQKIVEKLFYDAPTFTLGFQFMGLPDKIVKYYNIPNSKIDYQTYIDSLCCLEQYDKIMDLILFDKRCFQAQWLLIVLISMKDKSRLLNVQCTKKIFKYLSTG